MLGFVQCDVDETALDKVLIVGMGNEVTLVEELSEAAAGVDVESSMGSGATLVVVVAAVGPTVSVVDVEVDDWGDPSSSTSFFMRTMKLRFDQGSV